MILGQALIGHCFAKSVANFLALRVARAGCQERSSLYIVTYVGGDEGQSHSLA